MNLTRHQINALNNCLKCSICVDSCPVANLNPKFPGPKQLGVDWLRLAQDHQGEPNTAVSDCSNCKTCETVCPSGVLVGTLNQLAKSEITPKGIHLREMIFSDPAKLGKLIHIWPKAGNFAMSLPPVKFLIEKTVGISAQASMPTYSTKTLQDMLCDYKPEFTQNPKEIIYFPGCFAKYNKPQVGLALVKILAKLNYKVTIPDFQCCGQPSISNARLNDTRKFAQHNLQVLKQYLKPGMQLLFSCPSCLLTFREEYKNILGVDDFAQFSSAMLDAGQFLLNHKDELALIVGTNEKHQENLAYHEPCHLKASGQGTSGLFLLKNIAGLNITPLEAGCCGMAGSYGLKTEKYKIAQDIGKNIKDAVVDNQAQAVITECGMCSVQIRNLTQLPVHHPLELLAKLMKV